MADYQVIARKFRPKSFKEVVGQDAIVLTLKNAIKHRRLAHAYLFCGPRGTGKTTLARLFAKVLNCQQPTEECEPCNQCAACHEITTGSSLDVLEIDGASHRGIEDIRQINEAVGYAPASGRYKVYIIDEVHMLTKEAFNALLKTLEEPPANVKFLFATTEPHKVIPTILSRCQRFNLNRIPLNQIVQKLQLIAKQLNVEVEEEALRLIAQQAEGGLRDAESLFDQILAFQEGRITVSSVSAILGLMPRDAYFELDQAGRSGNFVKAFEIAHQVFTQGKDLMHFVDGLIEHFRHLLLLQVGGQDNALLALSAEEKTKYMESARLYTQEQCLNLIEELLEAQQHLRLAPSSQIALESLLLHVIRSHYRLPIEYLVRRLSELEQVIADQKEPAPKELTPVSPIQPTPIIQSSPEPAPQKVEKPKPSLPSKPIQASIHEDPTPTAADLGLSKAKTKPAPSIPAAVPSIPLSATPIVLTKKPYHYDTLLQFAAVELEGKLQKHN